VNKDYHNEAAAYNDSGQAVRTIVPLSSSGIILYRLMGVDAVAGKVTVGLTCAINFNGLSTYTDSRPGKGR